MSAVPAVLLPSALAGLALWKKALTPLGTMLAWAMALVICLFGGLPAFLILAVTFLGTVAADKLAGKRADPHELRRKSGRRDAVRVFCNVGIAAGMMAICGLSGRGGGPQRRFLLAYAAVMAESLSDSLASKLGPLGRGDVIDLCSLRKTQTGLSGGVSAAGTAAAALGAAAIGGLSLLFPGTALRQALTVALIGFAGCLFDSLLGSVVQVKYRCPVCGKVSEREVHCGVSGAVCRGFRAVNNDAVNLLANCFAALLAVLIF